MMNFKPELQDGNEIEMFYIYVLYNFHTLFKEEVSFIVLMNKITYICIWIFNVFLKKKSPCYFFVSNQLPVSVSSICTFQI